jgi:hypothetical protein
MCMCATEKAHLDAPLTLYGLGDKGYPLHEDTLHGGQRNRRLYRHRLGFLIAVLDRLFFTLKGLSSMPI